jgi:hypothetical protein
MGLLIILGLVICPNSVNIFLKERTKYVATTLAFGALVFHWARIADLGISPINMDLLALAVRIQLQYPPLRANVMVLFSIIAEVVMIIPAPLTQVWNGNESFYASLL